MTTISLSQIDALRTEAAAAGDREQVRLCDVAAGLYMAQERAERAHSIADQLAERSTGGQFGMSEQMVRANARCCELDGKLQVARAAWRACETAIRDAAAMAA